MEDKFILYCNKIFLLNCVLILFIVKMYMYINILVGFCFVFFKCILYFEIYLNNFCYDIKIFMK